MIESLCVSERERERENHEFECATCSIISVLTQWGATLVIQLRERGSRTAKYQAALDGGHDVLVLISEVWGGFSPEAMRFLGELAQARNDGIDIVVDVVVHLLLRPAALAARLLAARMNRHGLCCSSASERLAAGRDGDSPA
eukprot:scaffold6451_cov78-Phaeocystis_antarctica.AAC.2